MNSQELFKLLPEQAQREITALTTGRGLGLWHMEEAGEQVHVTCPFCLAGHACIYLAKTVGIMSCGSCQMELAFVGHPKTEAEAREIIKEFISLSENLPIRKI